MHLFLDIFGNKDRQLLRWSANIRAQGLIATRCPQVREWLLVKQAFVDGNIISFIENASRFLSAGRTM